MAKWNGWAGTILDIDLTSGKIVKEALSEEWATKYIGGCGFGGRILYDELKPGIDPLGPENIVMVGQGPLSGTIVPASGRYDIIGKSPQTGIFGRSNGGGFFGPEIKWAGYDLIIFRGKSEKPVYLYVEDDHIELRDASHLWGKDTWVTQEMIRKELGDHDIQTLKIGPAGENLCFSSAVIANLSRAAGRISLGAVWGSKKLKAIAIRGTKGVNIARPEQLKRICQQVSERLKSDPNYLVQTTLGTVGWVSDPFVKHSYYGTASLPGLLSSEFDKKLYDKNLACFSCPLHCSHFYTVKEGKYTGTFGEGVEGNTVIYGCLDPRIGDADYACHYNTLCNKLGLHIDAPGMAIRWAMQLYEAGIITKEDTDGIEVTWGNQESALKLLEKIAYRQGIGEILDGYPRQGAEKLGRDSELYISHVKGLPGISPGIEMCFEWVLAQSVATRGRDHLTGISVMLLPGKCEFITDETREKVGQERYGEPKLFTDTWLESPKKAKFVYDTENAYAVFDSVGVCKFISRMALPIEGAWFDDLALILSAVTGVDYSAENVAQAGERQRLIERAFNAREGIRRIDDYPYAFHWLLKHNEPHPRFNYEAFPITLEQYDKMLDEYYKLRGCDLQTGIPTRVKLEEVGLKDVADDLEKHQILPK